MLLFNLTLLHALEYAQQFSKAGGRDAGALMWCGQVDPTILGRGSMRQIHDAMPLEPQRNLRAEQVMQSNILRQSTFTATELGAYDVRARVSQAGSGMAPAEDVAHVNVVAVSAWASLDFSGTISKAEEQRWQTPILGAGTCQFDLGDAVGAADLYVRIGAPPDSRSW